MKRNFFTCFGYLLSASIAYLFIHMVHFFIIQLAYICVKGRGVVMNCACYGVVKLRGHGREVVERMFLKDCKIVT